MVSGLQSGFPRYAAWRLKDNLGGKGLTERTSPAGALPQD